VLASRTAVSAFAPGRVNLIGEHTDYNGGRSLAFAIKEGTTVRAVPLAAAVIEVFALDLGDSDRFALTEIAATPGWRGFVRGVAAELIADGHPLRGTELQISGTVPQGSGLSSSASLCVSLCLALLAASDIPAPPLLGLARLCSRVEHRWVGANSGMLDQIASLGGAAGAALHIDFSRLTFAEVPLDLGDYTLATLDSGQEHKHGNGHGPYAGTGYNRRREECAEACAVLGVASLSESTLAQADQLPDPLRGRARHVVTENERVLAAVAALEGGDLARVGQLLNESHASLRDDYEVSTPTVERAVERLLDAGAVGARLIGGGFGGHVLGLFEDASGLPHDARVVTPGPGARLL
jgi:galactokinase